MSKISSVQLFVLRGACMSSRSCHLAWRHYYIGKECFSDHLQNIHSVLKRIRDAGLKLQPPKSKFFQEQVTYLGHILLPSAISVDPIKEDKVCYWHIPQNPTISWPCKLLSKVYSRVCAISQATSPLNRA